MKVEELAGRKVWVNREQFRSVPGVIARISTSVNLDDVNASINASTFLVHMDSGDEVEVTGSDMSKIESLESDQTRMAS
jgi:hypothetical protein